MIPPLLKNLLSKPFKLQDLDLLSELIHLLFASCQTLLQYPHLQTENSVEGDLGESHATLGTHFLLLLQLSDFRNYVLDDVI